MNILNKINYKNFKIILYFFLLVKIILCFLIGDNDLEKEWKIITNNLINYNSFSYYEFDNKKIPSAYMPPLYAYYIYLFYLLGLKNFLTIKVILISQSILSIYSTIIFKKILDKYFLNKTSTITSLIFLLFPLNFYASTQISSVTIQIFLFLHFIFYFINFDFKMNYVFFGIISAFSILIRGEFLLLFMICCFFIFLKYRTFFKLCISILLMLIMISPFVYRNYKHFNEFVIVKSSGYNLWRGNNIYADVNGSFLDENIYPELQENKNEIIATLTKNNQLFLYEIKLDNYYKSRAIKNIKEDPLKYIFLYLKKFLYFIFINPESNYPNYFKFIVILPEIILSVLFLIGILYSKKKKFNFEFFLLITFYFLLIPIFFILPRYKLFILPLILFYCSYFIEDYFVKLRNNK